MARKKGKSIKDLRAEADAVEAMEKEKGAKAKPVKKKKAAPRKTSRAKTPVEVRKKLFWGVFNQSLKRVALFEYNQKKDADKKADELSKSGKSQHFVQRVKEEITE